MEQIEAIFEELNYPSAVKLKQVLRNRNIAFDARLVEALAKGESVRQVQTPTLRLTGKITSAYLNDLWMADLIDLTQLPSQKSGASDKYILVVQDVFSRRIFAEAMIDKTSSTVLAAWERVLTDADAQPRSLTTDAGTEFLGEFGAALRTRGIKHTVKDNLRQIATIDSAIGLLKKALVRDMRKNQTSAWSDRLEKVTAGHNKSPNGPYLKGKAPADVEDNADLQAVLVARNKASVETNRKHLREREANLRIAGFFRVLENRPMAFRRGWKPIWGAAVHEVSTVDFDTVISTEGLRLKTKFALPVTEFTRDGGPVGLELNVPEQTKQKNRLLFQPFADRVIQHFGVGRTVHVKLVTPALYTHLTLPTDCSV
mgnify:CR=1 FL=1